jgi:hypothetical protein
MNHLLVKLIGILKVEININIYQNIDHQIEQNQSSIMKLGSEAVVDNSKRLLINRSEEAEVDHVVTKISL